MKEDARSTGVAETPIPVSVKGDVRRERLLARLSAALDEPWTLTLVSAPAGAGKTRLLAQWAADIGSEASVAVVWVTLERGEADLPLVRAALEGMDDPVLQAALSRVPKPRSVATARALARALRESARRIVIVIDDVHRVETDEMAEMLSAFVQSVPGNVHVVLSGRGMRAIPLARRRITGVALELDSRELAFTAGEVRTFFGARGIRLSQGEITTVMQQTEGWPAGLQLMVMTSAERVPSDHPLRGDDPEVADYFLEEVFRDLDRELTRFLEVTAVPDEFTLDLAARLADGAPAAPLVDRLLRLDVLTGPDGDEPRYHYHPLLRDFLRGRLRARDVAHAERLERLAAEWFAEREEHLPAFQHATRSGDAVCLAALLRRCGMQLVLAGQAEQVMAAVAKLPAAVQAEPVTRMLTAAAELSRGDAATAVARLRALDAHGESEADRRWRLGLHLHTAVRRGSITDALDDLIPELRDPSGEEPIDTYAYLQAAMGELYIGELDRADEFARIASDLAKATESTAAELQAEAVRNTSALFRGRLREVLESGAALDRRWHELGEPENPYFEVTRVWRYWVPYEAMVQGDAAATLRAADRVIDGGVETAIARGLHGMLALLAADTATDPHLAATALLDTLTPREDMPLPVHWYAMMSPFAVHAFNRLGETRMRDRFLADVESVLDGTAELHVLRAIAALHDHREGVVRGALAPVLEGEAPCLLPASMIDAWLVEATLDVHEGEPDRAQLSLATALALAEPESHVRRVAEAGPVIARLMAARATPGTRTRFADAVRERLASAGVLVEEELTQRERIVLRALSRNATLRQIAQQEYISPNTVKTHVRNIYRKLGVSDREGVAAAAQALGVV